MNKTGIIEEVEKFVKKSTLTFDSGHDWWHLDRVRNMALLLQNTENKGDRFLIELGALLHDVNDSKFRKKGEPESSEIISVFLEDLGVDENIIREVISINKFISFSSKIKNENVTDEFLIVQDADRLDAIGAIGIARAFNYGGFKANPIYIPDNQFPSTIGHFYDKLLLLKDLMNTTSAKEIATERHLFLEKYLEQFFKDWDINFK
jgi:uncharacterized protein